MQFRAASEEPVCDLLALKVNVAIAVTILQKFQIKGHGQSSS